MKTAAILAALVGSAAAFAPTYKPTSTTALKAFADEIGAQEPLGFWDPLSFCLNADQARFDRLRYVEIKHGRIAMLAIVGHMVTTAGARISPDTANVPAGIKALTAVPVEWIYCTVAFIGLLETLVCVDKGKGEFPGDLRNGTFKWSGSEKELREKRSIELNNGRAAQMGILGLMVHEQLTGEPYVLNAFLGYPTV